MKTVAFIPARGGSKGIPGKNTRIIAGKPLIAWSIERALDAFSIDEVYVSTDSEEIASLAVASGARVPFIRPADISGDEATTESAMLHFCGYMREAGYHFENLVLLQATSPVRGSDRLDDAVKYFEEKGFDSMVSVSESHRFFWKNLRKPKPLYDCLNRPRRQDISVNDKLYMETGSFYIVKRSALENSKNRVCGVIGLYVTPEEESYEIDSFSDFDVCEALLINQVAKEG